MPKTFNLILAVISVLLSVCRMSLADTPAEESVLIGKRAPELAEGEWLNSPPRTIESLRGKVVLIEFWTFDCSNCLHTIPYIKGWYRKYRNEGVECIGVHTPEFDIEKNIALVQRKVSQLEVEYPIVTDNRYRTWTRYHQRYWPALYLIDKHGIVRFVHIGEGQYDEAEDQIKSLLAEHYFHR